MVAGILHSDELLIAAAKRLDELGVSIGRLLDRASTALSLMPDIAVASQVQQLLDAGMSERATIERVAAELPVPSLTFDGACKEVKRMLERLRQRRNDAMSSVSEG